MYTHPLPSHYPCLTPPLLYIPLTEDPSHFLHLNPYSLTVSDAYSTYIDYHHPCSHRQYHPRIVLYKGPPAPTCNLTSWTSSIRPTCRPPPILVPARPDMVCRYHYGVNLVTSLDHHLLPPTHPPNPAMGCAPSSWTNGVLRMKPFLLFCP